MFLGLEEDMGVCVWLTQILVHISIISYTPMNNLFLNARIVILTFTDNPSY